MKTTKSQFDFSKPAKSPLITYINDNGGVSLSILTSKGIVGTHEEFREIKTDYLVIDQFGDSYEICEDYIWQ